MIARFAILSLAAFVFQAQAVLITHRVTIQPIRVHNGFEGANPEGLIYVEETAKIWAQAGIEVKFLPLETITNALFLTASSDITKPNSLFALAQAPGNGASSDPSVINLWFVKSIDNNPNAAGFAQQSQIAFGTLRPRNGILISERALSFRNGLGLRDVFAHELGHNLGLFHSLDETGAVQAAGEQNLMSRSSTFPQNAAEIFPDGPQLSQLNPAQVTRARAFTAFVKPLPPEEQYEYPPASLAITAQPQSVKVHPGESAAFRVETDAETASFQWYRDNSPLPGKMAATLHIDPVQVEDGGSYFVRVSAGNATVQSNAALLEVVPLQVSSVKRTAHSLELSWHVLPGRAYRLQSSQSLTHSFFNRLDFPILPDEGFSTAFLGPPTEQLEFFRLELLP